jgi:hypothetical protein
MARQDIPPFSKPPLIDEVASAVRVLQECAYGADPPLYPRPYQLWADTTTGVIIKRYVPSTGWVVENPDATAAAVPYLPLAGGTMSGAIAMGTAKITGLGDGSGAQDAAAYGQVSVKAATTAVNARIHAIAFPVKGFDGSATLTLGAMPACIVQNAYLTSSAVTVSDGSNLYTLKLRNATGAVDLMAAAKTTNADDFVVNTAWPLAPAQNLTLALGDVLTLVVAETGTGTDLTAAQISLTVTYKVTT